MRAEPPLRGCGAGDGLTGAGKEDHLPAPGDCFQLAGAAKPRVGPRRWLGSAGCECSRDVCADVAHSGGVRVEACPPRLLD